MKETKMCLLNKNLSYEQIEVCSDEGVTYGPFGWCHMHGKKSLLYMYHSQRGVGNNLILDVSELRALSSAAGNFRS